MTENRQLSEELAMRPAEGSCMQNTERKPERGITDQAKVLVMGPSLHHLSEPEGEPQQPQTHPSDVFNIWGNILETCNVFIGITN